MIPPSDETRPGSSQTSVKPTLEALLRVKRAERPDAAFWTDFERGLAQKQLAAIVEPCPWWLGFALLGRRVGPLGLPVSAAAAALLAIMVMRTESPLLVTQGAVEFGPVATAKVSKQAAGEGNVVAAAKKTEPAGESPLIEAGTVSVGEGRIADALAGDRVVEDLVGVADAVAILGEQTVLAGAEPAAGDTSAAGISPLASLLDLALRPSSEVQTASQITIAQNLAAVTAEAPELVAANASSLSFASSLSNVESDLSAVGVNSRQARLLAMADMPELGDANAGIAQVRERMVHRLDSDESNYAAAGRLGYGADRLSLRF